MAPVVLFRCVDLDAFKCKIYLYFGNSASSLKISLVYITIEYGAQRGARLEQFCSEKALKFCFVVNDRFQLLVKFESLYIRTLVLE